MGGSPFIVTLYLISSVKILAEYERGVIFRLGKLLPQPKGPGVILVFAPIDRIVRVSLRTVAFEVRLAERDRLNQRAKIIHAEVELDASAKLAQAAVVERSSRDVGSKLHADLYQRFVERLLARQPAAIRLGAARYGHLNR